MFILGLTSNLVCSSVKGQTIKPQTTSDYYTALSSGDSFSLLITYSQLDSLSDSQRLKMIENTWDLTESQQQKNNEAVKSNLLYYLSERTGLIPINSSFDQKIAGSINDTSALIRRSLVNYYVRNDNMENEAKLLTFLNDTSEDIRTIALTKIRTWQNAKEILTNYINQNEQIQNRSYSVGRAKHFLQNLR